MTLDFHVSGRLSLAYETVGSGGHLLICLHGYGKDRSDFTHFAQSLENHYKCLLVDLPFHGESKMSDWAGKSPLSVEEWNNWVGSLIREHAANHHTILGFSIGGRLALAYAQSPLEGFRGVLLLAPDGILLNPWNRLFTRTSIGRSVFRYYMRPSSNPQALAMNFEKWSLISDKRRKLIIDNISGAAAKQKLLDTWLILRNIWPDLYLVDSNIGSEVFIMIYLGRFDKVIRSESIKKQLARKVLSWPIVLLDCGHDMMNKSALGVVREELVHLAGIE